MEPVKAESSGCDPLSTCDSASARADRGSATGETLLFSAAHRSEARMRHTSFGRQLAINDSNSERGDIVKYYPDGRFPQDDRQRLDAKPGCDTGR